MKRILTALLALFCANASAADEKRPNTVVFISDDHSQLDSQAYGSTEVPTPSIVRLAAEGLTFSHAFVASPSCGLSRTQRAEETGDRWKVNSVLGASNSCTGSKAVLVGWLRVLCGIERDALVTGLRCEITF